MSMERKPIINILVSPTPGTMKGSPCPVDSHTGKSPSPLKPPTRTESYFRVNKKGVIIIYDSDEEVKEAAANLLIPAKIPDTPPIQTVRVKGIEGGPSKHLSTAPELFGSEGSSNVAKEPIRKLFPPTSPATSRSLSTSNDSGSVNQWGFGKKYW